MSGNVPNNAKHSCQCSILSSSEDHRNHSLLHRPNQPSSVNSIPGLINLNSSSTILRHPPLISNNKNFLDVGSEFRSQTPIYDSTLELPPAMPPPKPPINVRSLDTPDSNTSPRRLSNLLMLLSDQTSSFPMIDATSPIHNDLEEYVTEKTIFSVYLKKDPNIRTFGFSVSDGASSNQGVFINAISPGSPADRCGRIRPLDRILKVTFSYKSL